MDSLGPDDQPDTISIGPIHDIPIIHEGDPRFDEERAAWSRARAIAQGLHSPDELIGGRPSKDWMVRYESVDRLIARARSDERTLPTLLHAAASDPVWQVRDAIVMRLRHFPGEATTSVLHDALQDGHPEVRWSAGFSLFQLGLDPGPGWSRDG